MGPLLTNTEHASQAGVQHAPCWSEVSDAWLVHSEDKQMRLLLHAHVVVHGVCLYISRTYKGVSTPVLAIPRVILLAVHNRLVQDLSM